MEDCELLLDFSFDQNDEIFQFPYSFDPFQQHDEELPWIIPSLLAETNDSLINEPGLLLSSSETGAVREGIRDGNPRKMKRKEILHKGQKKHRKEILHRDVERQRRQEMGTLYRQLRSLLPLEYIKGRRSICDHMHEAVNYVKDLQNKIQKLSDKRDQLESVSKLCELESTIEKCLPLENVTVTRCWPGAEAVVKTDSNRGIPLWKVLEVLGDEEQGLSVVNCVSTRADDKFIHTIQSEVSDEKSFDLPKLQHKLENLTV